MRCRKISIWSMIVCKTYPYVCFGAYEKFGTTILKRITRLHAHWKPSFSRRKNSTSKSISLTIFQYFSIFCVAFFSNTKQKQSTYRTLNMMRNESEQLWHQQLQVMNQNIFALMFWSNYISMCLSLSCAFSVSASS